MQAQEQDLSSFDAYLWGTVAQLVELERSISIMHIAAAVCTGERKQNLEQMIAAWQVEADKLAAQAH